MICFQGHTKIALTTYRVCYLSWFVCKIQLCVHTKGGVHNKYTQVGLTLCGCKWVQMTYLTILMETLIGLKN